MLKYSVNYSQFKPDKLLIYSPNKRKFTGSSYTYELPIMYNYDKKDQPLNLEGPEMHTVSGITFPSSGSTIDTYLGIKSDNFINKSSGTINHIYHACVREVWNSRRFTQNIKLLPSIECVYSLTDFPFFSTTNRHTGSTYPNALHCQYLQICKETIFRLPLIEDGEYVEIPRNKLMGMYLSFIPVFRMNKIVVQGGTSNHIKIQMDLKECVVTHISSDIILQDNTLDNLGKDKVLTEQLLKQWSKLK